MTGIGMAAAGGATAPPPPPLTVNTFLTGGVGPYNVSGASGDLYTAAGSVIGEITSGGTPPYSTGGASVSKDGGTGTVVKTASGDGIHNTIGWSGMGVGDNLAFHLSIAASDSSIPQQNAAASYPSAGTIIIHRQS